MTSRQPETTPTGRGAVVVPTYNEAENIESLVAQVLKLGLNLQVIIVDDNSPDGTGDLGDKMAAADAILFASPSYFESVTPQMKALIDRTGFYNNRATGRHAFDGKVGGAMAVAYRTGLATTWCQMLIFILAQRMIVPGIASFPNAIASEPGDVLKDKEGMDKAREIGEAMAKLAQRLA